MKSYTKSNIVAIARRKAVDLDEDWSGAGAAWSLLESMMADGCVVVLKLDGQREPATADNGNYTLIAMGGPLGDVTIRGDFYELDEGLCYLIGNYDDVTTHQQPR